jgi:hypothetical protein
MRLNRERVRVTSVDHSTSTLVVERGIHSTAISSHGVHPSQDRGKFVAANPTSSRLPMAIQTDAEFASGSGTNKIIPSLAEPISPSDAEIAVVNGAAFPATPFLMRIGNELIEVIKKLPDDLNKFQVRRGQFGTAAAPHASVDAVSFGS